MLNSETLHEKVVIRKMVEADVEGVIQTQRESWRHTYPSPENGVTSEWVFERSAGFSTERANQIFAERKNDPKYLDIVATTADGNVVGMLRGDQHDNYCELKAIYVHPKYIGYHIGGMLMDEFLNWIDTAKPCRLECVSYNERAIGFYEHYGFKKTDKLLPKYADVMPSIEMIRPAGIARQKTT